jgi:predicted DNA-binding antitoxin AbrB/MazE fold protein
MLGGNMETYTWTINGTPYPNQNSLNLKEGERVELVISNTTDMSHPMHLHGHIFEVTEIDGQKIAGAKRDTILVPPKSTIKVVFDANNPGIWAYHCHILYHIATGMFTVLKYENADTQYWKPEKTSTELENPLEMNNSTAVWKEWREDLLPHLRERFPSRVQRATYKHVKLRHLSSAPHYSISLGRKRIAAYAAVARHEDWFRSN